MHSNTAQGMNHAAAGASASNQLGGPLRASAAALMSGDYMGAAGTGLAKSQYGDSVGAIKQQVSPMESAVSGMEKALYRLSDLFGHLESRLTPVLRPVAPTPPTGAGVAGQIQPARSEAVETLTRFIAMADALAYRMEEVRERLDT